MRIYASKYGMLWANSKRQEKDSDGFCSAFVQQRGGVHDGPPLLRVLPRILAGNFS